ncbi:glycosyltransferase involved in cell wall biosynthesis [Ereboglobus sp. PH5-5]|uniref:glycosyltransferase family 2 protein n=1 Tax=Ereboglobus sp. PH5-5 TaxID=2940529 RepID=UPI0024062276|nr:glycosyltransferase family 2 protein [Ereboglobus sp. PH5-5]MDF9834001.1 glycosyltransferase involved in cell wall biosynthesis [Ereboglobus sp. PH5-5]
MSAHNVYPSSSSQSPGPAARPDSKQALITVVTPLWNESDTISALAAALRKLFQDTSVKWEWLAVNDGSSDDTAARVRKEMRGMEGARLVCLTRNFGQQAAYRAGLDHASGDAVVFLDADLQDPPEFIPEMIARWREGARLVVGRRRSRPERGVRGLLLRGFHVIFGRLTNNVMPRDSGTFGLMDRVVVDELKRLPERNLFLPALRCWLGYRQATVWYDRHERAGTPKQTYAKLFNYAWNGITSFSEIPLRFISWLGLFLCFFGTLCAMLVLVQRIGQWFGLWTERMVMGFATQTVGIFLLGGVQLLCLGIVGEYMARIFREIKGRPHYLVEEIIEEKSNPKKI